LRCDVGGLLRRLPREIARRLQDDSALATAPGDDRGPVFAIIAPTGPTLYTAPTRLMPQGFVPPSVACPFWPTV
jgi:hypothetical protein